MPERSTSGVIPRPVSGERDDRVVAGAQHRHGLEVFGVLTTNSMLSVPPPSSIGVARVQARVQQQLAQMRTNTAHADGRLDVRRNPYRLRERAAQDLESSRDRASRSRSFPAPWRRFAPACSTCCGSFGAGLSRRAHVLQALSHLGVDRVLDQFGNSSRYAALAKITHSRLLKSWLMPALNRPMISTFLAWSNDSSRSSCSERQKQATRSELNARAGFELAIGDRRGR